MTEQIETVLRSMIEGDFSSIHIGFNDSHACNYVKAADWADDPEEYGNLSDWPSAEDRERAMTENSVWSIQWYPQTPVGFHRIYASTLEGAVAFAKRVSEESSAAPPKQGKGATPEGAAPVIQA